MLRLETVQHGWKGKYLEAVQEFLEVEDEDGDGSKHAQPKNGEDAGHPVAVEFPPGKGWEGGKAVVLSASFTLTWPSSTVVVVVVEEEEEEEEEEKGKAHWVRPYMAVREKPESMKKRGMMAEAVLLLVLLLERGVGWVGCVG